MPKIHYLQTNPSVQYPILLIIIVVYLDIWSTARRDAWGRSFKGAALSSISREGGRILKDQRNKDVSRDHTAVGGAGRQLADGVRSECVCVAVLARRVECGWTGWWLCREDRGSSSSYSRLEFRLRLGVFARRHRRPVYERSWASLSELPSCRGFLVAAKVCWHFSGTYLSDVSASRANAAAVVRSWRQTHIARFEKGMLCELFEPCFNFLCNFFRKILKVSHNYTDPIIWCVFPL